MVSKKISSLIFIIFYTIILFICSITLYFGLNHHLFYKNNTTLFEVYYEPIRPFYADEDYVVKEVNNLLDYSDYTLNKCNFNDPIISGNTDIFTSTIKISENLSLEDFTFALVHELVHLKYFTGSERFCNYKAFIVLYESNNTYFKNIALAYANLDLGGKISYQYSCAGYIEDYLKNISIK